MPDIALAAFERQAEAFVRARAWREWQFRAGSRPGRGLVTLYDEDFPDLTSIDLFLDLRAAQAEDPRQHDALLALLAAAHLEGRTREQAVAATRFEATADVSFEDETLPWRAAPARWARLPEVARRHALEDAWRERARVDLLPLLERWQPALLAALAPLAPEGWLGFWDARRGLDLPTVGRLAEAVLSSGDAVYSNTLRVYLGHLDLPIDDLWPSDADWAFRAEQFDAAFPARLRLPTVVGTLRELGLDPEAGTGLTVESMPEPGARLAVLDVPGEVHVLLGLAGGYRDYARTLRGMGAAQHALHTDRSLPFAQRWLGDPTPTRAYGRLFEDVLLERAWLASRLDFGASDDFRVVAHLARWWRVRDLAARARFEARLWESEPGSNLAAEFEASLTAATRTRHFPPTYLLGLHGAPWSAFSAALDLRAEVFAAHLRAFLRREFDEEWYRGPRAGRFLVQELWRPGRRHTAEALLGFMGFEGFDPAMLWAETAEVLAPL